MNLDNLAPRYKLKLSLFILLVTLACGSINTTKSENQIGNLGDTITQGNYSITLVSVETAKEYGFFVSSPGKEFLAVEIIIKSNADTGVDVNSLYAKLRDASGYEYSPTVLEKDPRLISQNNLPNGEFVRGWITFEIPEDASGFIFTYEPIAFLETIRIRFDLGQ